MSEQDVPLFTRVIEQYEDRGEIHPSGSDFDQTDFHRGHVYEREKTAIVNDGPAEDFPTHFDTVDGEQSNVKDDHETESLDPMCWSCCWAGNSVHSVDDFTDLQTLREERDLSTTSQDCQEVKVYSEKVLKCLKNKQEKHVFYELFYVARIGYVNRLQVCLSILDSFFTNDAEKEEFLRASYGEASETPLHVALIYNQTEAAKILIDHGKKDLVMKPYTHYEYEGTTALHFAVVNGNLEAVDKIMSVLTDEERYEILHTAGTGAFFKEKFKASELPLTLSVWCGYKEMFVKLIEYGASPFKTESDNGNNIIHSLVLHSVYEADLSVEMYNFVLDSFKSHYQCMGMRKAREKQSSGKGMHMGMEKGSVFMQQHLLWKVNSDGYTPLAFAAKLGYTKMFHAIMCTEGVYKYTQWRYGPARYELYDMTDVDTLQTAGSPSAMELLIYDHPSFDTKGSLACLQSPPMKKLIDLKWKNYRAIHLGWALLHYIYTVVLTLCAVYRPLQPNVSNSTACSSATTFYTKKSLSDTVSDSQGQLYMAGAVFVVLNAMCYVIFEIIDIAISLRLFFGKSSYKPSWRVIWKPDPFRTVITINAVLTVTWFMLFMFRSDHEDSVLSLAVVFSWHFGLFFFKAHKGGGFLTVMIWKMIITDLMRFVIIFVFVLSAFSAGMYVVYQEAVGGVPDDYTTTEKTILKFFNLIFGLSEFDNLDKSHSPTISLMLYIWFLLLVVILLLNMLIAAFSATYSDIDQMKNVGWKKLRTEALLLMERRLHGLHGRRMGSGYEIHNINVCGKKTYRWFLPVENVDYHSMSRKE